MKKQLKHILPVILTFITVMLSAVCVNAKTLTNTSQVLTLYPKSSKIYNENRRMYAPANETILNTNLYYGNKATSIKAKKSSYVSTVYHNNYAPALTQDKLYPSAYLKAKKAGTTTITYKIGKQKYSQKVTIKKYANPFKTLKINNLNLASKFKSKSNYTLSYNKYRGKTLKLQYSAKKGWSLNIHYLEDAAVKGTSYRKNWIKTNGTFTVTKKNSAIIVYAYNSKTSQDEQCIIFFK